ncbi:MAG: DNA repair protein RecN [Phycisphaerae bacterium]|nr:DNA repair protein RecN [Phycisphaerae bacterium]
MLRELHISNLAIIEDVQVELDPGLVVFTGETGAGKSLVLGALQILLGMKPTKQMVRAGEKEGRVSGLFDASDETVRQELGELTNMTIGEDEILVTRRLLPGGRGSCTVNGHPVTVTMLEQVGERLIDLHGQHDHQFLLKPANQLSVLDAFAGCQELRERIAEAYQAWQSRLDQRLRLAENAELRRRQLELYEFQAAEIDEAGVEPGELEALEARHRRLANVDKIRQRASTTHAALGEDEGLVDQLRAIVADLGDLVELDEQLAKVVEPCESASLALEEAANDLRRYVEGLDFEPGELGEVEARLALLRRLCDKYGGTVEDTLVYREKIRAESAELRRQQEDFSRIDALIVESRRSFEDLAAKASSKRRAATKKLAAGVNKQLAELGMDKAVFDLQLTECEPAPTGFDAVEMMVRTNPGQPSYPLRRIASGGELSRVMLGLKSVLAGTDRVSILVFDEVDAHVGGRLGSIIGDKLRRLADQHQVICITHLPQIAAYADQHLKVRKVTESGKTRTEVRTIGGQDRVEELAEMIAGANITPTSRRQARELLERANP